MTGVGKVTTRFEHKSITIFVKTLNSKQLDISTRLPLLYREREIDIRNLVAEHLVRGKIDLSISIDDISSTLVGVQKINELALKYYANQLEEVAPSMGLERPSIEALLRLPGVLVNNDASIAELSEEEWQVLRAGLIEALEGVNAFRRQEGQMLEQALARRIEQIGQLLLEVEAPEAERIPSIKQKLEEALQKLSPEGIDRGRLEQELIYYIEKLDINEEKDRLRHHLSYFVEVLALPDGQQGKTLGFIAQEIGREINTLGSKSNNATMQQLVVRMKDELEQIKEQSLNVL